MLRSGLEKSDAPELVPNSSIPILSHASVSLVLKGDITLARFTALSLGERQRFRGAFPCAMAQVGLTGIQSLSQDSRMLHPSSDRWAWPFLSSSDVVITAVIHF